jgi:CRISPR/Cas system-associated exonuclease Cas4 (RecB family)
MNKLSKKTPFDWTIDEQCMWPPQGRPRAPFGPTIIEVIRSCPLRSCFEYSQGYERRMSFDGRIGTAFHKVLESFDTQPIIATTPQEIAEEARRRFDQEIALQEQEAAHRSREQGLPRDQARVQRAIEALISTAQKTVGLSRSSLSSSQSTIHEMSIETFEESQSEMRATGEVEVEILVTSQDGQLRGRIDRAEHGSDGVTLIDYKSALRDDLPERYERQVQLYAWMWFQTRGVWPSTAEIIYPLTGRSYRVDIDPAVCEQIGVEATALIKRLEQSSSTDSLALPGDVCKVCEFRPWCRPFWHWQATEQIPSVALERAYWGFEGTIINIASIDSYWKVRVAWQRATVEIIAPIERFPQLQQATIGTRVRALEMQLRGLRHQPRAIVNERSELFILL